MMKLSQRFIFIHRRRRRRRPVIRKYVIGDVARASSSYYAPSSYTHGRRLASSSPAELDGGGPDEAASGLFQQSAAGVGTGQAVAVHGVVLSGGRRRCSTDREDCDADHCCRY